MFFPWHLHKYAFSSVTCRLLCEEREYQFKGKHLFKEVSLRFNYPYITNICLKKIFSFLANHFQSAWEYLGLPIDEIEFVEVFFVIVSLRNLQILENLPRIAAFGIVGTQHICGDGLAEPSRT